MKIELLAPPYSGHLHPILAIARQLQPQHDVTVLSTPGAQAAISARPSRSRPIHCACTRS